MINTTSYITQVSSQINSPFSNLRHFIILSTKYKTVYIFYSWNTSTCSLLVLIEKLCLASLRTGLVLQRKYSAVLLVFPVTIIRLHDTGCRRLSTMDTFVRVLYLHPRCTFSVDVV